MIWQDVALSALQIGLSAALIPALVSAQKPDRWTCGLNAVLLYAMAGVMATLSLWFSATTTALVAGMWSVLLVQGRP